jgi:hypothetical protein
LKREAGLGFRSSLTDGELRPILAAGLDLGRGGRAGERYRNLLWMSYRRGALNDLAGAAERPA